MDPTIKIEEPIDVITRFYKGNAEQERCIPCRMRWRGHEIELTELALKHPTVAGKRMIHVFHVSDGTNGYRLEFDAEALTWMLVCIISGEDHA